MVVAYAEGRKSLDITPRLFTAESLVLQEWGGGWIHKLII